MRWLGWVLLLLSACESAPPKMPMMGPERKEFIHHMGHNQKLIFELQSETGDPLDQKAINALLDKMIHHYEAARKIQIVKDEKYTQGLDAMFDHTLRDLRAVRSRTWTKDNVGENFNIVEGQCRACHDRFAP